VECFNCRREFYQLPKELEDIIRDNLAYAKRQRLIERIGKTHVPETPIPEEIKEMLRHNERLRKILGSQLDFLDKWIDLMTKLEEWNKAEEERRRKFTPKRHLK